MNLNILLNILKISLKQKKRRLYIPFIKKYKLFLNILTTLNIITYTTTNINNKLYFCINYNINILKKNAELKIFWNSTNYNNFSATRFKDLTKKSSTIYFLKTSNGIITNYSASKQGGTLIASLTL